MAQYARYVKGAEISPIRVTEITERCKQLYDMECKARNERLRLQSLMDNDVSMIHVGEVLEIDKELLAIEPDCYCIKVRNMNSKQIEYVTKKQLRK